jgi:hypothetical protein
MHKYVKSIYVIQLCKAPDPAKTQISTGYLLLLKYLIEEEKKGSNG